ncbi:GntR family transcriptional regulator [Shouchella xiaoxiensis]
MESKRVNGSTRDYVYQTIKNRIIDWDLVPGAKISEKEVAMQLQVSRTPVREAFLMLAQEELLDVFPQSGTMVSYLDLALVEEGRFIRQTIEQVIVREACVTLQSDQLFKLESNLAMQTLCLEKGTHQQLFELDEAFHQLLFEGCQKMRSWKIIRQLNSHFDRLRMLRLASNSDWLNIVQQHHLIFEAISNRDADKAVQQMTDHLQVVNFEKQALKEKYLDYFK